MNQHFLCVMNAESKTLSLRRNFDESKMYSGKAYNELAVNSKW